MLNACLKGVRLEHWPELLKLLQYNGYIHLFYSVPCGIFFFGGGGFFSLVNFFLGRLDPLTKISGSATDNWCHKIVRYRDAWYNSFAKQILTTQASPSIEEEALGLVHTKLDFADLKPFQCYQYPKCLTDWRILLIYTGIEAIPKHNAFLGQQ